MREPYEKDDIIDLSYFQTRHDFTVRYPWTCRVTIPCVNDDDHMRNDHRVRPGRMIALPGESVISANGRTGKTSHGYRAPDEGGKVSFQVTEVHPLP